MNLSAVDNKNKVAFCIWNFSDNNIISLIDGFSSINSLIVFKTSNKLKLLC